MSTPPMDWYPDPADGARERYWDGQQWTHNTRPARPATPVAGAPGQDPWSAQGLQGVPVGQDPFAPRPADPAAPAGQPQQYPSQPQWGGVQQAGRPDRTPDGVPFAGYPSRAIGFIVDSILTSLVATALGWNFARKFWASYSTFIDELMVQARAGNTRIDPEMVANAEFMNHATALNGIWTAVLFVYLLLCWKFLGATLGQKLMGLRVVPVGEGHAPRQLGWGAALVRTLVLVFSATFFPVQVVSFLMPLGTRLRQTLHDMASRTQVVRAR
ncbi:RDD family protein [Luteococcus sediminum]